MKCKQCAHWSDAAHSCYAPPELETHVQFPEETRPCLAFRDRTEAAADPQRCPRCTWWSQRGRCFCPRPAATPGEGERCPEFRPGEVQLNAHAGPRFTGGRGSRRWVRQPETVKL